MRPPVKIDNRLQRLEWPAKSTVLQCRLYYEGHPLFRENIRTRHMPGCCNGEENRREVTNEVVQ